MGAVKNFAESLWDESDEVAESRWYSTKLGKKKSRCRNSPVDNYEFLKSFAGGIKSKGKKFRNEPVIVLEVDEAMKERIVQSDAALQSSSSKYNSKSFFGSRCPDLCTSYHEERFNTPRSLKTATDRKASDCTQRLRLADNDSVSIISDEDNGSSGEQMILEQEISSHEMESRVVVEPNSVTYGRNCYWNAQLTFFRSSIKLDVREEEGHMGSPSFEWKTVDLISIESRCLDHFRIADVCLYIKPKHPKLAASGQNSGILEVKFTVSGPHWTCKQELIKSLDEQYKEKWDVDLESYELFEDITYLEGGCDSISISRRDFQLLQPEKFINDTIVDFYIEYMKKKIKPADERFHFFNSFFFRKLADFDENQSQSFDAKAAFQRVRKWTKKVNIFQKDYIFIPVNFSLHWSLVVICHPGEVGNFTDEELVDSLKVPCILHMNSIKGSHKGLEYHIKCYLWEEWKARSSDAAEDISMKFMNLRFLPLEVPQQQNSYDCGLFMLHYMEFFVKQAPIDFNPLNNFISEAWFYPMEASLKRARIKRLIVELAESNSQQVLSSGGNDKLSSELKEVNEEEAEVQFLHETCNSKEICHGRTSDACANRSRDVMPIIVKPLRSVPKLCSELPHVNAEHMDIELLDSDTNGAGILTSSLQDLQSHCEGYPETGDNGGSLIAGNDQNLALSLLFDPSHLASSPIKENHETEGVLDNKGNGGSLITGNDQNVGLSLLFDPSHLALSPMKESHETEGVVDKHVAGSRHSQMDSCVTCIDKSLNSLQLMEGCPSSSSRRDDVVEALVVEDSGSSDVQETCLVEDSDSDDLGGGGERRRLFGSWDEKAIRKDVASKRKQAVGREARKRVRRGSSSGDLQVIYPCE